MTESFAVGTGHWISVEDGTVFIVREGGKTFRKAGWPERSEYRCTTERNGGGRGAGRECTYLGEKSK